MTTSRRERLAEELRSEISILIRREIRDPRIGFVTLTGASVSPDLTHVRIYVTVLGTDAARTGSRIDELLGQIRGSRSGPSSEEEE
jgi:ribosome-binding factor A